MARIAITAVLARIILPLDYGLIVEASVLLAFLTVGAELGLGQALVQRRELEPEHESTALWLTSASGVVCGLVLMAVAESWSAFRGMPALKAPISVLALTLILRTPSSVPRLLLMRDLRMKEVSVYQFIGFIAQSVTSIVLGFARYGALALAWGAVVGALFELASSFFLRPIRRPFTFRRSRARELMKFGNGLTFARLANNVALQGDNLVVGISLGPVALGLYNRAYSVLALPAGLLQSIDGALFPALARLQDDTEQLRSAFRSGILFTAALVVPTSAFVTVLAPEIVGCLMGPNWRGAIVPLQILGPSMFFRTVYKIASTTIRAKGAVNLLAVTQVTYALCVVLGAVIGCRWGLSGAALGVAIAVFLQYLFLLSLAARLLGEPILTALLPSPKPWLLGGLLAVVAWGVAHLTRVAGLPQLGRLLAAGLASLVLLALARWVAPKQLLGAEVVKALDAAWHGTKNRFRPSKTRQPF